MDIGSGLKTVVPLKYATLEGNENHICTVVLSELVKQKVFTFFGPEIYQSNYVRYYGHLTNQRLILEFFPYTDLENKVFGGLSKFAKVYSPGVGFSTAIQLDLAKRTMSKSDNKWMAFPLDKIDVNLIDWKVARYVRLGTNGQEDMYFSVYPWKANMLTSFNIKENWAFPEEFLIYLKKVIEAHKLTQNQMNSPKPSSELRRIEIVSDDSEDRAGVEAMREQVQALQDELRDLKSK